MTTMNFTTVHFAKYACYKDNQIKEDEIGGACRTYAGDEECIQNFTRVSWRVGNAWEIRAKMEYNIKRVLRNSVLECAL
jgi:hypothetical protein